MLIAWILASRKKTLQSLPEAIPPHPPFEAVGSIDVKSADTKIDHTRTYASVTIPASPETENMDNNQLPEQGRSQDFVFGEANRKFGGGKS